MIPRHRAWVIASGFFLSSAVLFAAGGPEAIEYPVDYESARSFLGEQTMVVAYRGEVELAPDNRWVSSIGSEGYFYLKKRSLLQTVVIVGRPGENGNPELKLWINNIRRRYPENHRVLVGDLFVEAAVEHGLGAAAAISRIYRENGIDAAYDVIRRIKDPDVRRSIFETFSLSHSLDVGDSLAVLQWTLPAVGDDEKAEIIVSFADRLERSDEITAALIAATAKIASGETRSRTVIYLATTRGLDVTSAIAAIEAVKTIPSSDDKADALVKLCANMPADPDVLDAWYLAARTIPSSDDKARALAALLDTRPDAAGDSVDKLLATAKTIPSSDEKKDVLVKLIEGGYVAGDSVREYLGVCRTIPSSDDKVRVLSVLLDFKRTLTLREMELFLDVTRTIPSSDGKRDVLLNLLHGSYVGEENISDFLATTRTVPSSDAKRDVLIAVTTTIRTDASLKTKPVLDDILATVQTIPSSSDRTEVVLALIRLGELDRGSLTSIAEFSARNILGSDDRERILKELIQ